MADQTNGFDVATLVLSYFEAVASRDGTDISSMAVGAQIDFVRENLHGMANFVLGAKDYPGDEEQGAQ